MKLDVLVNILLMMVVVTVIVMVRRMVSCYAMSGVNDRCVFA